MNEQHGDSSGIYPANGADSYLSVAVGRLSGQSEIWASLETKASILLATALAELAFLVTVGGVAQSHASETCSVTVGLAIMAALFAVVQIVVSTFALRVRAVSTYPDPEATYLVALKHRSSTDGFTWDIARTLDEAYLANLASTDRKKSLVVVSQWVAAALTFTVAGAAVSWVLA